MKKIAAIIAALLLIVLALFATGCETMMDQYQSDTYQLGESSMQ